MPHAGGVDLISKMHEVDPVFREVVDLVYGGAVDAREAFDIAKRSDPSEVHVPGNLQVLRRKKRRLEKLEKKDSTEAQRRKRQAQVGLASNVLGLGAGTDALRQAVKDPKLWAKVGNKMPDKGPVVLSRKGKLMAVGSLALQTANVGGDIVANRVLSREAQKKVSKALEDIVGARRRGQISTDTAVELAQALTEDIEKGLLNNARMMGGAAKAAGGYKMASAGRKARTFKALQAESPKFARRFATATGATGVGVGVVAGRKSAKPPAVTNEIAKPPPPPKPPRVAGVAKSDEVEYVFAGEIAKRDEDKRLVFGWCNLSTVDGAPVVDLQGDYAPIEEIEKSAYKYVVESRKGGDMHQRLGEGPLHTADLVESFVVTPEKLHELGVPEEVAKSMNTGWWIGMKVNDDQQWQRVKNGERTGFSVHGSGKRLEKSL